MANRAFARVSRRKTQWAGFGSSTGTAVLPQQVALTAGTAAIISFNVVAAGALGLFDEEFTITRMIGQFAAFMTVGTADLKATVAVGCGVTRSETVTAGVASLPSPEDDPDFEWLYYGVFGLHNAVSGQTADHSHVRASFDVKGQRIVRLGQTVVWIAESQTSDVQALVGGRYLAKLT